MKGYYARTFAGMGLLFLVLAAAAFLSNRAARDTRDRYERLLDEDGRDSAAQSGELGQLETLRRQLGALREFGNAWKGMARVREKDAADRIRSDMEAIAQRQLGLVTDSAITPQPDRHLFQGSTTRIQKVTLRASGKDLAGLLTWLGKVEEKYPAAIVEHCEFTSNVGGNTGLTIRLVQPLEEPAANRNPDSPASHDVAALSAAISAQPWRNYVPGRVKAPIAVGFQRNPLQPAIALDRGPLPAVRDEDDEISPKLETALDGRVRSVIRGVSPVIVVDGRVFRVGDEVTIGSGRDKPIPEARVKLKAIGNDALLFQVSGGAGRAGVQCEVRYALPSFLSVR